MRVQRAVTGRAVTVCAALAAACAAARGASIWSSGPGDIIFTKASGGDPTDPANQDRITSNVWLTRDLQAGLYNIEQESSFPTSDPDPISPKDTQWAFSGLNGNPVFAYGSGAAAFATLTFEPWRDSLDGSGFLQGNITTHPGVVHLLTDDIYIDINFLSWDSHFGGGFSYVRAVAPAGPVAALWNGGTGNWSDPTQWSSSPNYPANGTPSGTAYSVTISGGTVNLDVNVAVNALALSHSGAVYGGKLNLAASKLIEQTTGAADKTAKILDLNAAITSGANGTTWAGNGITSSVAAGDAAHYGVGVFDNALLGRTSFGGIATDTTSILTSVAHLGDANDNGIVDIQDLTIVANNWQQPRNNWAAGDLNRDGVVDIQDFTIVANNWQQTSSFSQSASLLAVSSGGATSVPEPAGLGMLLIGGALVSWRRRNRRPVARSGAERI